MARDILRQNAVATTPTSRPRPGKSYEHSKYGYVTVQRVEDDMVVFTRPDFLNNRQQHISQFQALTVDPQ